MGKPAQPTRSADPATAQAIQNLTPEQANQVLVVLEKALKRRKIQLWGYLTAGAVMIVGTLAALVYVGRSGDGEFTGWAFLVPLGVCGVVLMVFGKWSERYRTPLETQFEREAAAKKR